MGTFLWGQQAFHQLMKLNQASFIAKRIWHAISKYHFYPICWLAKQHQTSHVIHGLPQLKVIFLPLDVLTSQETFVGILLVHDFDLKLDSPVASLGHFSFQLFLPYLSGRLQAGQLVDLKVWLLLFLLTPLIGAYHYHSWIDLLDFIVQLSCPRLNRFMDLSQALLS